MIMDLTLSVLRNYAGTGGFAPGGGGSAAPAVAMEDMPYINVGLGGFMRV